MEETKNSPEGPGTKIPIKPSGFNDLVNKAASATWIIAKAVFVFSIIIHILVPSFVIIVKSIFKSVAFFWNWPIS